MLTKLPKLKTQIAEANKILEEMIINQEDSSRIVDYLYERCYELKDHWVQVSKSRNYQKVDDLWKLVDELEPRWFNLIDGLETLKEVKGYFRPMFRNKMTEDLQAAIFQTRKYHRKPNTGE